MRKALPAGVRPLPPPPLGLLTGGRKGGGVRGTAAAPHRIGRAGIAW
jgi:hypothetical protein